MSRTGSGMDGPSLAAVGIGAVLVWGGIRGYSILLAVQNIIQGKPAGQGQSMQSLVSAASGSGSGSSGPVGLSGAKGGMPENAASMYAYFRAHGLSHNGAAGVIGNIAQESGGNPESVGSGGNGLIGWTPPLAGAVTGHTARDLAFQLAHVMAYIAQNGSVADINAHASSAAAAAEYFMSRYERPAVATENLAHRQAAAEAVARSFP